MIAVDGRAWPRCTAVIYNLCVSKLFFFFFFFPAVGDLVLPRTEDLQLHLRWGSVQPRSQSPVPGRGWAEQCCSHQQATGRQLLKVESY